VSAGSAGWARVAIDVRGAVFDPIEVALSRSFSVSGRIEVTGIVDGGQAAGIDFSQLLVSLDTQPPVTGSVNLGAPPSADGSFSLPFVPGGTYVLRLRAPVAQLVQIAGILHDRDSLDGPVEISSDVEGARIVLAPRESSLLITVRDDAGRPVTGAAVVVFADDRAYWTGPSRRVQFLRLTPGGSASATRLPPGKYFVAAGTDIAVNQVVSIALLERLMARATAVDIEVGRDRTVQVPLTSR
jgi:hypothetical protein